MIKREEYAVVIDFLPYGRSSEAQKEPIVQVVGELYFTLLEAVPKADAKIELGERIYIGRDARDKIDHIKARIEYGDLTSSAQNALQGVVTKIVLAREKDFVSFLNHAGSINIRSHALEHLPSIGKKHLQTLLNEREKKPFESFEDVKNRIPHLGKAEDIFVQRILSELKGVEKYYLFVKMPASRKEEM